MKLERDNVKAGAFVLIGLVLFVLFVLLLTDFQAMFEPRQKVGVYFQLADGTDGLRVGDDVTLGDQVVGRVTSVRDVFDERRPGRVVGKLVRFSLPARYELGWDARIEVIAPPIGTGAKLNIRHAGRAEPYDPERRLDPASLEALVDDPQLARAIAAHIPTGALPGTIAPSRLVEDLTRDLGFGDLQRRQLQQLLADLNALGAALSEDAPLISAELREALPQLTARLKDTLDEAHELLPEARQTMANLRAASEDVRSITGGFERRAEGWFDGVDAIVADAGQISETARRALEDVEPNLQRTVGNLAEISSHFREQTMAEIDQVVRSARQGAASFDDAAEQIARIIASQGPVIERTMANLQLTSDQLKLTAIEVRRSPWRLLYEPGARELETDNVYDAARSFALAAGALQTASESLRAFSAARPDDEQAIARKLEHLEALFARFREAEAAFWSEVEKLGR